MRESVAAATKRSAPGEAFLMQEHARNREDGGVVKEDSCSFEGSAPKALIYFAKHGDRGQGIAARGEEILVDG